MKQLTQIHITGFRSIKDATIEMRPLNVLIGPNGAGKSNLIDFFRLMNYSLTRGFQDPYLRERGPASAILHFGPKVTGVVRGELTFAADAGTNLYRFTLADSAGDRLTFTKEEVQFNRKDDPRAGHVVSLLPHPSDNSGLAELWAEDDPTARFTKNFLKRCRVYQFHDTSLTANLRDYSALDQGRHLYADGGNLSAVLLDLRTQSPNDYASIVRTLQAVLPWFEDFELEPEGRKGVLLRWRMVGRGDYVFGPGQLSDGSLRIMAIVTLLLLPMDRQPDVIILDEPELGLHPAAEQVIAGLIKNVSRISQVLISTQSSTFIDHFSADDVIVVECEKGESRFTRQSQDSLKSWMEHYTLSQIWSKNLIGGRP
ncbi:MAG: AAA family ATPase [Planctomycetota bacterium]|nr:AAA family ATPase [Planctomycetota bacterium]